jgi:hypothetical protein
MARTLRRLLAEAGMAPTRTRRAVRHRSRRERMPQAGMLLQADGSRHDWLEGRGLLELRLERALNMQVQLALGQTGDELKPACVLRDRGQDRRGRKGAGYARCMPKPMTARHRGWSSWAAS